MTDASAPNPPRLIYPIISVVVLVAVSIYIFVLKQDQGAEPSANPRTFDRIRIVEPNPKARVDEWQSFSWSFELPTGGHYLLTLRNLDDGQTVVDSRRLTAPTWTPTPEVVDALGDSIEMHVVARGGEPETLLDEVTRTFQLQDS